jgi:hypothetical protein
MSSENCRVSADLWISACLGAPSGQGEQAWIGYPSMSDIELLRRPIRENLKGKRALRPN